MQYFNQKAESTQMYMRCESNSWLWNKLFIYYPFLALAFGVSIYLIGRFAGYFEAESTIPYYIAYKAVIVIAIAGTHSEISAITIKPLI